MQCAYDTHKQGSKFIALADYNAMGSSEVSMKEGAEVVLLKVGCAGWVLVKKLGRFFRAFFFLTHNFPFLTSHDSFGLVRKR